MGRHWRHARAGLILLAMVVGLIDGCPLPPARKAGAMRDLVERTVALQIDVLRPFRPLEKAFKLDQRWKLFPVAERDRHRMWIETAGDSGDWQIVFRAHDDAHTTMGDALEYRRIRGSWNPGTRGPRGAYGAFVAWISRTLMRRDPRITRVRVRMERIHIRSRGRGYQSSGQFDYEEVRSRAEMLP